MDLIKRSSEFIIFITIHKQKFYLNLIFDIIIDIAIKIVNNFNANKIIFSIN